MISVTISFLSLLEEYFGKGVISLSVDESSTIKDLFEHLNIRFGNVFKKKVLENPNSLNKYILIGLNGKDIKLFQDLKTPLHDGDEISFLPAIAGG